MSLPLSELLAPNELLAVQRFVERLRERYPARIRQTTLFGSKARGDSREWSDIDILVIVDDEDWRFQHAISDVASDLSLEHDVLIGPRVIGEERWARMEQDESSLYRNIAAEGVPLSPATVPEGETAV
jgi:predicted nucleotidyltransferase